VVSQRHKARINRELPEVSFVFRTSLLNKMTSTPSINLNKLQCLCLTFSTLLWPFQPFKFVPNSSTFDPNLATISNSPAIKLQPLSVSSHDSILIPFAIRIVPTSLSSDSPLFPPNSFNRHYTLRHIHSVIEVFTGFV
jgi:hypothetical protein